MNDDDDDEDDNDDDVPNGVVPVCSLYQPKLSLSVQPQQRQPCSKRELSGKRERQKKWRRHPSPSQTSNNNFKPEGAPPPPPPPQHTNASALRRVAAVEIDTQEGQEAVTTVSANGKYLPPYAPYNLLSHEVPPHWEIAAYVNISGFRGKHMYLSMHVCNPLYSLKHKYMYMYYTKCRPIYAYM